MILNFLFNFLMKFLQANRIAPNGSPRSAVSHLVLCCLPMSHKKDARLKCSQAKEQKNAVSGKAWFLAMGATFSRITM